VEPIGGYLRRRSANQNFALFCQELRTLVSAGMTVVEAVDTLSAKRSPSATGAKDSLAREILTRLSTGQSLSSALVALGAPPVLVAAVRAGERTSNVVEALDAYLHFNRLVHDLRGKIVSAAIYPALVTALGMAISFFLLLVVMPNFARMYQNLGTTGRGLSYQMVEFSRFVSANHFAFTITVLCFGAAGVWMVTSGQAATWFKRALNRLPYLRERVNDFQLAMTYQTLALLLRGGYSMTESIEIARGAALAESVRAGLSRARHKLERGAGVSQSLAEEGLCDEVDRRLMSAAERNGDFYLAAEVVSQLHKEKFELFVERATRIVEPILLMAVALFVGTIVVMMYLPVFDVATRLR
jgi:general secretion pathway protein F